MSRRISDAERVVGFFQTADESATAVMQQVIKGILRSRFEKKVKKIAPRKPQLVPANADALAS